MSRLYRDLALIAFAVVPMITPLAACAAEPKAAVDSTNATVVGTYVPDDAPPGLPPFEVREANGRLVARIAGQLDARMVATSATGFSVEGHPFELEFGDIRDGRAQAMTMRSGDRPPLKMKRVGN